SFIAQYQLHAIEGVPESGLATSFNILPGHTRPPHVPVEITTPELRNHALRLPSKRNTAPIRKASDYGIRAEPNNTSTVGNLLLLEITYRNSTNLAYDIEEMRFKNEDRKITNATNVQTTDIKPTWHLYPQRSSNRTYRNIYVLKTATFP